MTRNWTIASAAGVIVLAVVFADEIDKYIGWPPYANAGAVAELRGQIEIASQSILWLQYENALKSGDRNALIRACNALIRAGYAKPAGCP